jgi:predicted lipid-binding transport protein (Tim44 family)
MGSSGSFPIDLVLFGMIAAFLVLRLRSILGRRTGYERPPQAAPRPDPRQGPIIEGHAEPPPAAPQRPLPDPASPVGQTLARMREIDRAFDAQRFLEGAEGAFRLIVANFAAGDRARLRPLLTEDTFAAFEGAIAAREQAGEAQRTEIRAVTSATIEEAKLLGTLASLTVRFVSDQINLTTGRDGQPVAGTDAVTEIVDLWTFERQLDAPGPAWRLAGTSTG